MSDGFNTLLFTCAICSHAVRDWPGRDGPAKQVSPICGACEQQYGLTTPMPGAFMDRRRARQIKALAEALSSAAHMRNME